MVDDLSIAWSAYNQLSKTDVKGLILGHIESTLTDRVSANQTTIECLKRQLEISLLQLDCQVHPLDSVSSTCLEALKGLQSNSSISSSAKDDCRGAIVVHNIAKLRYKGNGDPAGFKLCCKQNKWRMDLFPRYVGNRFHVLFHSAGLIFVHREKLLVYLKIKSTAATFVRNTTATDLEKL